MLKVVNIKKSIKNKSSGSVKHLKQIASQFLFQECYLYLL